MKTKKKRRLRKEPKIILALLLVIITIIIIKPNISKNKENTENNTPNKVEKIIKVNYKDYVTNEKSEYNNEIKYVSEGMKLTNFISALSKEENYVNKSGSYTQIKYNFEQNLSYEELENIFLNLNKSNIVKLEIIGKSYDGRNIYSIEIGKGERISMFEGNIHAAEIAPLLFLTKYSVDLVNSYESKDETIVDLLNTNKIVIVPTINPDGYDYSVKGKEIINDKSSYVYKNSNLIEKDYFKANINGIDLNRSFPSRNGGLYFKKNTPSYTLVTNKSTKRLEYFPGYELGSEPETQALMYFMYKYQENAHVYVAVHSAGRVIYHGKPDLSDTYNKTCSKMANIVSNTTGYTPLGVDYEDVGYGSDGSATDMIAEIKHGFKFSTQSGRLTSLNKIPEMASPFCAMTIETLESYTQNLETIKSEYNNKKLSDALTSLVKY